MYDIDRSDECATRAGARAYELLFEIENGLRELVITLMDQKVGVKWLKQRIPNDIRDSMRRGKEMETATLWGLSSSYHPIYYVDFPDLKKIIMQNNNWREIFGCRFNDKEKLASELTELEPIRNKIAHTRLPTERDNMIMLGFHRKLSIAIGGNLPAVLDHALGRYGSIKQKLTDMASLMHDLHKATAETKEFLEVKALQKLVNEWWFDETYLLTDLDNIEVVVRLAEKYVGLPRGRGSGYRIERWLSDHELVAKSCGACATLESILRNG